jgi:hypothetical protein
MTTPTASGPRGPRGGIRPLLSVLGAGLAVAAVGAGAGLMHGAGHHGAGQHTPGQHATGQHAAAASAGAGPSVTVSYPAQVPSGYSTPSGIAADAAGGGVWYFAESAASDTLFHYSARTGATTEYDIPPAARIRSGEITPIVLDGGDAWIGINSSLVEVSIRTKATRILDLPVLPLASSRVAHPPAGPAGVPETAFEDVESMTAGANGTIDIGRLFSKDLQTYDPATGAFGTIALPADSVLEGWGPDLAGWGPDLAGWGPDWGANWGPDWGSGAARQRSDDAGQALDAVLWQQPAGRPGSIVVAQRAAGAWTAVSTGSCTPQSIAAGPGRVLGLGTACTAVTSGTASMRALADGTAALTGTGAVLSGPVDLVGTTSGAEIVAGGQATPVSLGLVTLGPAAGGVIGQNSGSGGIRTVPQTLGLVASAGGSRAWFTAGDGGPQIGLITVGS